MRGAHTKGKDAVTIRPGVKRTTVRDARRRFRPFRLGLLGVVGAAVVRAAVPTQPRRVAAGCRRRGRPPGPAVPTVPARAAARSSRSATLDRRCEPEVAPSSCADRRRGAGEEAGARSARRRSQEGVPSTKPTVPATGSQRRRRGHRCPTTHPVKREAQLGSCSTARHVRLRPATNPTAATATRGRAAPTVCSRRSAELGGDTRRLQRRCCVSRPPRRPRVAAPSVTMAQCGRSAAQAQRRATCLAARPARPASTASSAERCEHAPRSAEQVAAAAQVGVDVGRVPRSPRRRARSTRSSCAATSPAPSAGTVPDLVVTINHDDTWRWPLVEQRPTTATSAGLRRRRRRRRQPVDPHRPSALSRGASARSRWRVEPADATRSCLSRGGCSTAPSHSLEAARSKLPPRPRPGCSSMTARPTVPRCGSAARSRRSAARVARRGRLSRVSTCTDRMPRHARAGAPAPRRGTSGVVASTCMAAAPSGRVAEVHVVDVDAGLGEGRWRPRRSSPGGRRCGRRAGCAPAAGRRRGRRAS